MAAEYPIVELRGELYHNLIPSRFPPVHVFERIAGGRDDFFAQIESITNPRLREKERLTHGLHESERSDPRFVNWNHAPFAYPNPEGSRFFGSDHKVLELAADLQTALAISVVRRANFLSRTSEPATAIEMRQLKRPVEGRFLDLSGTDYPVSHEARLSLGRHVVEAQLDGLVFRPPERPTASAIVVRPSARLGNPVQCDHFKFVWNGRKFTIVYSFGDDKELEPDQLREEEQLLAA